MRRGFSSVSISWFHPQQQALKVWRVEANIAATFMLLSPWSGLALIFLNRKKNSLSNCFPSEEKPHINDFYVSGCSESFILCTNHFLQFLHPLKSLSYSYLGSLQSFNIGGSFRTYVLAHAVIQDRWRAVMWLCHFLQCMENEKEWERLDLPYFIGIFYWPELNPMTPTSWKEGLKMESSYVPGENKIQFG